MAASLEEYNQKRNFERSGEPEGRTDETVGHLRFVVQYHLARRDHYDFRLEWNGTLLSWAIPKGPSYSTHDKRLAVQVEDHPLEYRNFEGAIPKGEYGGGVVMLWDEGFWEPQSDAEEGLRQGSLKFVLKGRRLKGKWALIRMKTKEEETHTNWLLLKERDDYVLEDDGISQFTTSIRTGRTMEEIEAGAEEKTTKNPFNKTDVQLASLVRTAPEGDDWLYELKYDGYRILAYLEGSSVRLMTRNGNDYTGRFQEVADSLASWASGRAMVLDGEMVITDADGRTDFQALQNYLKKPKGKNLVYIVFDLLALDGADLRGRQLIERKDSLESLLKDAPKKLLYSQYIRGHGSESFTAACQSNLEGVVGKRADSVYSGTRNGDWIKIKCAKRQEFVIGGYTLSDKKTSGVSSLLLGVYEGENLIYIGRAGSGLTAHSGKELEETFEGLKRKTSPFQQAPEVRPNEIILWLEPDLVAEIQFSEWTEARLIKQASFKGLRTDKAPREVKREEATDASAYESGPPIIYEEKHMEKDDGDLKIQGVTITHPDKMLFRDSEITKADVARYYEKAAERMMTYVGHRILSVVRCPKGVGDSCFFMKHPATDQQGIVTMPIENSSGEQEPYFYIENATGLISEVQMGTLEFHTWGSRIESLEKPDMMVFDLDPDVGMDLERVRQGVKDVKGVLAQLSLVSYLKTSGGKGYHIVVPFTPSADWDTFHDFSKRVAEVMEQQWPDRYTSNIRKEKRKGRIFIDWIRNGRGATSVAPYSIRARKGAKVSMPITWEELETVAPDDVGMADALQRIEDSDPWKGFFDTDQRLK